MRNVSAKDDVQASLQNVLAKDNVHTSLQNMSAADFRKTVVTRQDGENDFLLFQSEVLSSCCKTRNTAKFMVDDLPLCQKKKKNPGEGRTQFPVRQPNTFD